MRKGVRMAFKATFFSIVSVGTMGCGASLLSTTNAAGPPDAAGRIGCIDARAEHPETVKLITGANSLGAVPEWPACTNGKSGRDFLRSHTTVIDRRTASNPRDSASRCTDTKSPPKVTFRPRAASFTPQTEANGPVAIGGNAREVLPASRRQQHRNRSMSYVESSGKSPIQRYTDYVTAEDKDDASGGPSRKHQRALVASAETEVELRERLTALQNSAATLSPVEAELVLSVFRKHFLFSRLTPAQLMMLVKSCEKLAVEPEAAVVTQGEQDAEHFYIVNEGTYQARTAAGRIARRHTSWAPHDSANTFRNRRVRWR